MLKKFYPMAEQEPLTAEQEFERFVEKNTELYQMNMAAEEMFAVLMFLQVAVKNKQSTNAKMTALARGFARRLEAKVVRKEKTPALAELIEGGWVV